MAFIVPLHIHMIINVNQLYLWTHSSYITHIQDVPNIAGPLVPCNHALPKWGLIHRDRESSVFRPLLYLQATTAGFNLIWDSSPLVPSSIPSYICIQPPLPPVGSKYIMNMHQWLGWTFIEPYKCFDEYSSNPTTGNSKNTSHSFPHFETISPE